MQYTRPAVRQASRDAASSARFSASFSLHKACRSAGATVLRSRYYEPAAGQTQRHGVRCAASSADAAHAEAAADALPRLAEVSVPGGRLVVRPITPGEIQAAGVVLTRAFAGSSEAVSLKEVLSGGWVRVA